MVTQLGSHPCIVQWVLFNEGWGQYAPAPVVDLVLSLDGSRLVDPASGWNDAPSGSARQCCQPHADVLNIQEYDGAAHRNTSLPF